MQFNSFITAIFLAVQAQAAINGRCTGSANARGICLTTTTCSNNGGSSITGACPNDPSNVKCCFISGCLDSSSFCTWTGSNNQCAGIPQAVFVRGQCPGPDNYQCCNYGA